MVVAVIDGNSSIVAYSQGGVSHLESPCDKHLDQNLLEKHMPEYRWLTVEDIRKEQRMRRETVIAAMLAGEIPYEQRGRIRYARRCNVEAWELSRLNQSPKPRKFLIHPDLAEFA